MKRVILFCILSILVAMPAFSAENSNFSKKSCTKKLKKLKKISKRLCVCQKCGDKEEAYTTAKCVRLTDRFLRLSGGEMPPCIPRYADGSYLNELFCYTNWKVEALECDPLFNQDEDQYDTFDETDGITEYERCLMNSRAKFDVCMLAIDTHVNANCYKQFTQPCYEEYEITNDNEALQVCLESVQWEINACIEETTDNFYFKYLFE